MQRLGHLGMKSWQWMSTTDAGQEVRACDIRIDQQVGRVFESGR